VVIGLDSGASIRERAGSHRAWSHARRFFILGRSRYCPILLSPNLREWWLQAFAGKLDSGRVSATSATDVSILSFTGVARMAWILPLSGPVSTVMRRRVAREFSVRL
jgi:hypothetical protein